MLRNLIGIIAGGVVIGALAACVPDPSLTGATKSPERALPAPDSSAYAALYTAQNDGAFVVPAVPVEKVPTHLLRQEVKFETDDAPGTIIIDPAQKTLHLVTGRNRAIRYGIAVGAAGFEWSGEAVISDRKHWPTWTPPKEMIARKPELAKWEAGQPGGPTNPLGARALYLSTNGVDYGYRIHGTPEWSSIGRNASSGCIRMMNQDVIDLYQRVPNGVKVVVLNRDGSRPTGLKLPPPKPVKTVPKPEEAPVLAAAPGAPAPGFPTMATPIATPSLLVAPPPALAPTQDAPALDTPPTAIAAPVNVAPVIVAPEPTAQPQAAPAITPTGDATACTPLPGQTTCE